MRFISPAPGMSDRRIRLIGAGQLLVGLGIAYFCAYLPLEAARQRVFAAGLYAKLLLGCCTAPALLLVGIICLGFGLRGFSFMIQKHESRKRFTLPGRALLGITIVGALFFFFWLQFTIEGYGYKF